MEAFTSIRPQMKHLKLLLLVLASVLYTSLWQGAPHLTGDSASYLAVAVDLQDGSLDALHDRTPGYPLLLLATGTGPTFVLFLVQLLLHLVAVYLLAALLESLYVPPKLCLVFVVLALLPHSLTNTVYLMTETLATFLLSSSFVALVVYLRSGRTRDLVLTGASLALATLVRPTFQLLFVLVACALVLAARTIPADRSRWMKAAASVVAFSLLILGGLVVYHQRHFDYPGLNPMLGFNLSTKTARFVERLPEEHREIRELLVASRDSDLLKRGSSHTGYMYIWQTIPQLESATGMNKAALSGHLLKLNLELIRSAPLEYLVEVLAAMTTYWMPFTTDVSNFGSRGLQALWSAIHFVTIGAFFLVTVMIFSLALFFRLAGGKLLHSLEAAIQDHQKQVFCWLLAVAILAYNCLVSTMVEVGNPRYRTPTDLLMIFATLLGAYWLRQLAADR